MVLDKLTGHGRPTSLDKSRARAYCTCSRCGRGLFGHFYSRLSFLFSFPPFFGRRPQKYVSLTPDLADISQCKRGWSGGAMVLDKLAVPDIN